MDFIPLNEGTFSIDGTKDLIPFEHEFDDRSSLQSSLIINIQPFLVRTPNELILLDCGIGSLYKGVHSLLQANLTKEGIGFADIDKILISHLHIDHCGGLGTLKGNKFVAHFPNAEIFVQSAELDFALNKGGKSYNSDFLKGISAESNLHLIKGDGKIGEHIQYEVSGGHTPFHQIFIINSINETLFFGGDVVPVPEQLIHKYIAKYDHDGKVSAEKRIQYGKKGAEENWRFLFYHATKTSSAKVAFNDQGLEVIKSA